MCSNVRSHPLLQVLPCIDLNQSSHMHVLQAYTQFAGGFVHDPAQPRWRQSAEDCYTPRSPHARAAQHRRPKSPSSSGEQAQQNGDHGVCPDQASKPSPGKEPEGKRVRKHRTRHDVGRHASYTNHTATASAVSLHALGISVAPVIDRPFALVTTLMVPQSVLL